MAGAYGVHVGRLDPGIDHQPDVVLAFFGFNESFRGEGGLPQFESDLAHFVKSIQEAKPGGKVRQVVLVSPIAHENLGRRELPDGSTVLSVGCGDDLTRYMVEKGSVTVDGVSLTITAAGATDFSVALIPHTLAVTTLGVRQPGDGVNLEVDVVAKYVERLLAGHAGASGGAR